MRALLVVVIAGCGTSEPPRRQPPPPTAPPASAMDVEQAERMLELLAHPSPAQIDRVMTSPGTDLIVRQQNISRRITAAQYRAVLAGITADAPPAIAAADDSERAARGVRGLTEDVWPALHWGTANTPLLAQRLAAIRTQNASAAARQMAAEWLPDPTPPKVELHIVMGGRAGAAALGEDIYFDVLATSYRVSLGRMPYPSAAEITEFFAHEAHHVGLEPIIERTRSGLALTAPNRKVFDIVTMLVSEGSATYFINAHRDLERMRRDPQYAEHLRDTDGLLATFERILAGALDGSLAGEALEAAQTPLVGSGFHSAGAVMLDAIMQSAGRDAVMRVLRDPRRLLVDYNAARRGRPFAAALADKLARLGT